MPADDVPHLGSDEWMQDIGSIIELDEAEVQQAAAAVEEDQESAPTVTETEPTGVVQPKKRVRNSKEQVAVLLCENDCCTSRLGYKEIA